MASAQVARHRGHGEDGIYLDSARNRYVGAISCGYGPDGRRIRRKVTGRTKQEIRDKLKALHAELDAGIKSSPTYTVEQAVEDWLRDGLDGRSERTRALHEGLMRSLMEHLGARPLRKLSAGDVRGAMTQLAPRFSNRSLDITRNCLERAITQPLAIGPADQGSQPGQRLVTLPWQRQPDEVMPQGGALGQVAEHLIEMAAEPVDHLRRRRDWLARRSPRASPGTT